MRMSQYLITNSERELVMGQKRQRERERENVQGSGGENKRLRDRMCCGEDELSDSGATGK